MTRERPLGCPKHKDFFFLIVDVKVSDASSVEITERLCEHVQCPLNAHFSSLHYSFYSDVIPFILST